MWTRRLSLIWPVPTGSTASARIAPVPSTSLSHAAVRSSGRRSTGASAAMRGSLTGAGREPLPAPEARPEALQADEHALAAGSRLRRETELAHHAVEVVVGAVALDQPIPEPPVV